MASALLVTYERKPILSRNTSVKKLSNSSTTPSDLSFVADSKLAPPFASSSVDPPADDLNENPLNFHNHHAIADASTSSAAGCAILSGNLSKDERSQLRKRLKLELDQVHSLALKVEARELQLKSQSQPAAIKDFHSDVCWTDGLVPKMSTENPLPAVEDSRRESQPTSRPSVVIPQSNQETFMVGGKEKRTPKANQLYLNSEFVSGKEKLSPFEKPIPKTGSNLKRSAQGNLDSRDSKRPNVGFPPNGKVDELFKQCGMILKRLMTHKFSWVFNEPVDVVKLGLHDYLKIIQRPMDLGTIKKKLDGGDYLLPNEFAADVRLTFANAMKYNPQGHDVYIMADSLRQIFEDKWKAVEEKVKALTAARDRLTKDVKEIQPPRAVSKEAPSSADTKPQSTKKSKPASTSRTIAKPNSKMATSSKRPMTFQEKQALSKNLESLPVDKLEQIIQIIRNKEPSFTQTGDEIEVDIDAFNSETLWELHRFVIECKQGKGKSIKLPEKSSQVDKSGANRQQELSNGVSRTPKASQKGSERAEEVDIGVDLPSGVFPPVLIDKDEGLGNKNSTLSSLNSESGTSSSDSGSSSGSDSDANEAHSAGAVSKVTSVDKKPVGSGAVSDGKGSSALKVDGTKNSVSGLDEENVPLKATLPGSNSLLEGEGNVAESEPSHEKRLRAALLRNRFADTILKAQEKTLPLNKTDRLDPEQLKKEREELERRQKEEKARLLAEAKAAEWARKKAEAEAAAEARRRREEEREAARLVLQNMEKSVEIDENSDILKDLEMLRSAPSDHVPSSGDETSPTHSSDGLPAFALQGGNPLEQLGLFMKSDEEDEELDLEPVLIQADNPAGDEDEEGEIED